MSTSTGISPRLQARIGGFLYLVIMVCGYVAEGYVRGSVIVSGDAAATAQKILASEPLYRFGGAIEFVTLSCDVTVGLILYNLLKPVNASLSLLAVFFRLVFVSIFGVLSLTHFAPLLLLKGGASLSAFSTVQLQQAALFSLRLHTMGFLIANVFFGIHCVLIGGLIARSTFLPRIIGAMLTVAGSCYMADSVAYFAAPEVRSALFPWLLLPGFVAEGSLALWLFTMGVNVSRWREAAGVAGLPVAPA